MYVTCEVQVSESGQKAKAVKGDLVNKMSASYNVKIGRRSRWVLLLVRRSRCWSGEAGPTRRSRWGSKVPSTGRSPV